MAWALAGCAFCLMTYFSKLYKWPNFIINMGFSCLRFYLECLIIFKFAINEFIMAGNALFMSRILENPSTIEIKRDIAKKWRFFWLLRDKSAVIFNISLGCVLIIMLVVNVITTFVNNDGKPYEADGKESDTLLKNIEFIVGNEEVYLVTFCIMGLFKLVIIVMFIVSTFRYLSAKLNMMQLINKDREVNLDF